MTVTERLHDWSTRIYGPSPVNTPFTWIGDERLAIGSLPTARTLPVLSAEGITHVINCRSHEQVWLSRDLAIERQIFGRDRVASAPMYDFGRPQPPRLWAPAARFGAEALDSPDARLFVHCHQGRRRSVLMAYAILRLRGHGPVDAADMITRHRAEAVLVDAYADSVERWLATEGHQPPNL
ncbi:MAG TPA: dual specificity protein phosphatase [Micromonosporaceae bacterium]|jgi:protein-tyrosine phosphatase